jgi:protein SSD1
MVWQNDNTVRIFSLLERYVLTKTARSIAKLAYSDAQRVIDGQPLGELLADPSHKPTDVASDILLLRGLASKLRAERFSNGTLALESSKLSFTLDDDGMPADCGQYDRTESNFLIEEVRISNSEMILF